METIKKIFINESTLREHIHFQNNNYNEYISILILLINHYNIKLTCIKKARILAASLYRNDKRLSQFIINNFDYDLPSILKTCEILDSRRYQNYLIKKMGKLKDKKKIAKRKSIISNLKKLHEGLNVSLTRSKIKFIKENWIKKIKREILELNTFLYPLNYWKKLIDLLHLKPSDFTLEWFSTYIFDNKYPSDSLIAKCKKMNKNNLVDMFIRYKIPYEYIKINYYKYFDETIKKEIIKHLPFDKVVKHSTDFGYQLIYEYLINKQGKYFIQPQYYQQQQQGNFSFGMSNDINIEYGELIKFIQKLYQNLYQNIENQELVNILVRIAEDKLERYNIDIEGPVLVLGDASSSMGISIKTSAIITSLLCKLCHAKLHLFNDRDIIIKNPPKTVREVLDISQTFRAESFTAPSCSLYPYLERKEIIKTLIIITDEEENTAYDGEYLSITNSSKNFCSIYKKYREEVYPCKLVFISFLSDNNNKDGPMVTELKARIPNIEKDLIQFRLNIKNPDLRKLDSILEILSLESRSFNKLCEIVCRIEDINEKLYYINNFQNIDELTVII